jgi:hypothetical protein
MVALYQWLSIGEMIHFIVSVLTDGPSLKFEGWQMPAFKHNNDQSHQLGVW